MQSLKDLISFLNLNFTGIKRELSLMPNLRERIDLSDLEREIIYEIRIQAEKAGIQTDSLFPRTGGMAYRTPAKGYVISVAEAVNTGTDLFREKNKFRQKYFLWCKNLIASLNKIKMSDSDMKWLNIRKIAELLSELPLDASENFNELLGFSEVLNDFK